MPAYRGFLAPRALLLCVLLCCVSVTAKGQVLGSGPAFEGTVDHILMNVDRVKDVTSRLERSIVPLKSTLKLSPGQIEGIHNLKDGVATVVRCGKSNLLLFPSFIAQGAYSIKVQYNQKEWAEVKVLGQMGDIPLAVGVVAGKAAASLRPLPLSIAEPDESPGLAMSGVGTPGFQVLSRVHFVGTPLPPLQDYRITDIRSAAGLPMLSVDLKVRGIPFRPWFKEGQTLAVTAKTLAVFCAGDKATVPIKKPSLEINPR